MYTYIPAFLRCGPAQVRPTMARILARAASFCASVRKHKSPTTVATPEKLLAAGAG